MIVFEPNVESIERCKTYLSQKRVARAQRYQAICKRVIRGLLIAAAVLFSSAITAQLFHAGIVS